LDPFCPAAPIAAYFDAGQNAWVLSRYADVFAGLRESSLGQTAGKHEAIVDEAAQHARLYAEVQSDIERMSTAWWRAQMVEVMTDLLAKARRQGRVDLVRDVIQPWSTTMLVLLNAGGAADSERLREISERMFPGASGGRVRRKLAAWRGKRAQAELDRMLEGGQLRVGRSMFFGLTQTLPSFLAKSWLALLENPGEMARLVRDPLLMPAATEELLRYAGVVHTFYRRAVKDVQVGEAEIAEGQLVILKLDSANFDPEKFEQPEVLDVGRRTAGQLGLGTGMHACVGAVLVRMACAVVTPMFLEAGLVLGGGARWASDKTLLWPVSVPVGFTTELSVLAATSS
jgi:cytochrome P450